jgi:uncharacterized protein (DUF736 family)
MNEKSNNNIGACWLKESKNGNKYMNGCIELNGKKTYFVIFKNKKKTEDKHPDYIILESGNNK